MFARQMADNFSACVGKFICRHFKVCYSEQLRLYWYFEELNRSRLDTNVDKIIQKTNDSVGGKDA